jgi:hypothetical protein
VNRNQRTSKIVFVCQDRVCFRISEKPFYLNTTHHILAITDMNSSSQQPPTTSTAAESTWRFETESNWIPLIQKVRANPGLYDKKHADHKNNKTKLSIFNAIASELHHDSGLLENPGFYRQYTGAQLSKIWGGPNGIRAKYTRECRNLQKIPPSGAAASGSQTRGQSKWSLFTECNFLDEHRTMKPSNCSYVSQAPEATQGADGGSSVHPPVESGDLLGAAMSSAGIDPTELGTDDENLLQSIPDDLSMFAQCPSAENTPAIPSTVSL